MRAPNVFAIAAQRLEAEPDIHFPCFAVLKAKGHSGGRDYKADPDTIKFMSAFSARETPFSMSDEFCHVMDSETLDDWVDNCILALCFVAAMVDAGDL